MRTKEDAISAPMVGDRWESRRGYIRRITKLEDAYRGEWAIVYYSGARSGSVHWKNFCKLAAGGKFIGGAA